MYHRIRWTSSKIHQRLGLIEPLVYWRSQRLTPFRYLRLTGPQAEPPVAPGVDDSKWPLIPWRTHWAEVNADFVLRSRFQIPRDWPSDEPVALHLPIGEAGDFSHPEALVYVDGHPLASCDRHHQEVLLPRHWCSGEVHGLALHGWAGGTQLLRFDLTPGKRDQPASQLLMSPCQIVQIHQPLRDFLAVARVALGTADCLDDDDVARAHLYSALEEAFKRLDTREPFGERFYASLPDAHESLLEELARSGPPLDVDVTAVGHAHIDVAWLWPLDQTRRKAGRTFHNVLHLMDQFPEFHFTQSQPQLYEFVRQDYPGLFARTKERVTEGRWEPVGGMWVEADCNLSGAESLVRQFLLGRTFFRQHFGEQGETPVLWLPDVFGYAWNLPQLIKEAGLEYFFTTKLGWSQYNRFPYDSFWWQGLDGTRILTHFSPTKDADSSFASTYNAVVTPEQVLSTWTNFQQKDWGRPGAVPPLLMSYGYGDGGGGPTREMVENVRVLKSFPAMPRVHCGRTASFFRDLEQIAGDRLPTWNGELYLEYHRGTYTTQARNKRANRKSEFLLHDVEFLSAFAATLDDNFSYPHRELHRAWELVCLNQFHDIIPGSSIHQVYVESQRQYTEVNQIGEAIREGALAVLAETLGGEAWVINPTSFPQNDLAFLPAGVIADRSWQRADGQRIHVQAVEGGLLMDCGLLPPYSVTPLITSSNPADEPSSAASLTVTPRLLENGLVRVEFNAGGDIIRIYDKQNGREVLPPGTVANQFQAFEDRPSTPDAWDVEISYDDRVWLAEPAESIEVAETGPLRAALQIGRRILGSRVYQRISLAHGSPRLDFDTTVHWQERHTMLKVAFPVDILSPLATYEIQWGNVERPTHRNTSWDWARFETCAHKWVDLSEGGYGVSLLNDCKYGHDIHDNVLRLTLLRSPTEPDPEADLGEHQFTYSLLPHPGRWGEFTIAQAYALNDPLTVWDSARYQMRAASSKGNRASRITDRGSFIKVEPPNVVIETVKRAEDGQGLIVRLYESQRQRGTFTVNTAFGLAAAWRTNLLEENQEHLEAGERSVSHPIKPYQIVTLRLLPEPWPTTGSG